jgi:Uma2 family endonuclease
MAIPVKILPHYTYEDYVQWEGKWEIIDGVPYAMSPAPVPRHQIVATNLLVEFGLQLKMCKQCRVMQPVDYLVTEDTILQPDMLIVCGEISKKYLDFPPALIAEILSPATEYKDRHIKYPLYESQQIRYYLIIDAEKNQVELYEIAEGKYQLIKKGQDISHSFILSECTAEINFKDIW